MLSFFLAALESDADRQMFAEVYAQHHSKMENTAIRILKNQSDAEDAVQNAFMQVIRHFEKISHISCEDLPFWLISIAICLLAAFVGIMCFLMRVTGEKLVFESMLFVYLGGLLVACHSFCKNGGEGQTSKTFFGNIISILLIFPIIFLGEIINCDYDTFGIILIVCAYMIKYICPKRLLQILILGTGMIYFYGIEPWSRWIRWGHIFGVREIMYLCFSLVAVVILFWYNGERGKNFKWTFYWIYPIHIFILYVLNTFLTLA